MKISRKRELREKEGKGLELLLAVLFFSVKKEQTIETNSSRHVETAHGNVTTSCCPTTDATF